MTTAQQTEHTVTVSGKPIFYTEAGSGPVVVLLHGGGPGATGMSNYARNIDALADEFRVIVPGHARLRAVLQGHRPRRPVRRPRRRDPGSARRARHRQGPPGGQLLRRRRRPAAGVGPARQGRPAGPDGPRRGRHHPGAPDRRASRALFGYYGGDGPSRDKLAMFIRDLPGVRRGGSARRADRPALRRPASSPRWSPTRRCAARRSAALRTLCGWTSPATARLARPADADPGDLGGATTRSTAPSAARCCWRHAQLPNSLTSLRTGHWVQWERADLFNRSSPELPRRRGRIAISTTSCGPTPTVRCSARVHLGYVVVESGSLADWRRFGADAIGLHVDELTDDVCGSGSTTASAGS